MPVSRFTGPEVGREASTESGWSTDGAVTLVDEIFAAGPKEAVRQPTDGREIQNGGLRT